MGEIGIPVELEQLYFEGPRAQWRRNEFESGEAPEKKFVVPLHFVWLHK